jgi:hypothetical protein
MKERATLANWRVAPYNRWAFHHVRELVPSADRQRPGARDATARGARELSDERFAGPDTDGIVALHRGKLVFERYSMA